jgi:hypothetical protein
MKGDTADWELQIDGLFIAYLTEDDRTALEKHFKPKLTETPPSSAEPQHEQVALPSQQADALRLAETHRLFMQMAMAAARRPDLRAVELLDMFSSDIQYGTF